MVPDYDIRIRRIYEEATPRDGARVLVDRIWPRGQRRDALELTEWYRDASPSSALRKRWHAGEIDFDTFAARYAAEIESDPDALLPLMRYARQGRLTLLSAVKDMDHSHMPVLRDIVRDALIAEDRETDRDRTASAPCYAEDIGSPDSD